MTKSQSLIEELKASLSRRRTWTLSDRVPDGLGIHLRGADRRALDAVVQVARSGMEGARFVALLVLQYPDLPWPGEDLAMALGHKLSKDQPEQKAARYEALRWLTCHNSDLVATLLRGLVLDVPESQMEVVLLADLCDRQRHCPDVFLDALKRVAGLPGQQMVMSGLVFRGFCDLPPEAMAEIRAEITLACDRFHDPAWVRGAEEARLIEIFGDLPSLAGVVLLPDVLELALDCVTKCLSMRRWHRGVGAALVGPLVMWKGEVVDVAPWMESVYEEYLAKMVGKPLGVEAASLLSRIRSGYYRQLKRNPVIEAKQVWRIRAKERIGASIRSQN